MLQIVEILEPAEQGRTTPYLCQGDDGLRYYIKGRNAGRRSQWCEWLAGHLGRALGLPIPPFRVVEVPAELLAEVPAKWREIGAGPAFASEAQPLFQWSEPAAISRMPVELRRDILVFDWWIRNMDRMAGNTNLLWDAKDSRLMVIDHNLAFDPDFDAVTFRAEHVFRADYEAVFGDLAERARYGERLAGALSVWRNACDNVPLDWHWENDERDVAVNFDPAAAYETLACCLTPDFWRMV
ncbi:MAG: hypothetical protein HZA64_13350 [Rhodocyclales bacterium]|nr:hypothetical protein [Rhodocyclales bacterium]